MKQNPVFCSPDTAHGGLHVQTRRLHYGLPYLIVDGTARTIEFLTRVFGATEIRRVPDEHGRIMHSEVRIGDTVVMIADGAEGWPLIPAHVHVYVVGVDATFKLALEAGATAVQEPT